jgi:hypothetical protein
VVVTAKDRERRARNQERQSPALPSEGRASAASDTWLARGIPSRQPGVIWLKRPMPDGQWPADQRLPRDDSFSWWVRSACGHHGGVKQWAFYREADADQYELIFRDNPCHFTRCPEAIMIENNPGRLR